MRTRPSLDVKNPSPKPCSQIHCPCPTWRQRRKSCDEPCDLLNRPGCPWWSFVKFRSPMQLQTKVRWWAKLGVDKLCSWKQAVGFVWSYRSPWSCARIQGIFSVAVFIPAHLICVFVFNVGSFPMVTLVETSMLFTSYPAWVWLSWLTLMFSIGVSSTPGWNLWSLTQELSELAKALAEFAKKVNLALGEPCFDVQDLTSSSWVQRCQRFGSITNADVDYSPGFQIFVISAGHVYDFKWAYNESLSLSYVLSISFNYVLCM